MGTPNNNSNKNINENQYTPGRNTRNTRWRPFSNTPPLRQPHNIHLLTETSGDTDRLNAVPASSPSATEDHTVNRVESSTAIVKMSDQLENNEQKSILETSNLSADAEEFVPGLMASPYYNQDAGPSTRYQTPPRSQRPSGSPASSGSRTGKHVIEEREAINLLTDLMEQVTVNPGSFDMSLKKFLNEFKTWQVTESIFEKMASLIMDQSIKEANFRYSGAKLCKSLHKECTNPGNLMFWQKLRTEWERRRQNSIVKYQENPSEVRGLLLFLAELMTQFDIDKDSLSDAVCFLITLIISVEIPENLKCICHTLKLAGKIIDSANNSQMNDIILALTRILNNKNIDNVVSSQIHSILDLRSSNWGQPAYEERVESSANPYAQGEPVFYGPDGTVLSPEESRFLEENLSPNAKGGAVYTDEYGQVWEVHDPMDELDEAFEEFLKFSKQQ